MCTNSDDLTWYRDGLYKVLGYGTAVFLAVAAWLISSDGGRFYIRAGWEPEGQRAWALSILSIIGWTAWCLVVRHFFKKASAHPTTPKRWQIWLYCAVLLVCYLGMVVLAVFDK